MVRFTNFTALKAAVAKAAPALSVTKTDFAEVRVTFRESAIADIFPLMTRAERIEKMESLAAYESDYDSAYETALAMAATGVKPDGVPALPPALEETVKHGLTYIDATPTWESMTMLFVALIENGDSKGRATAISEMKRLAAFADSVIAESKSDVIAEYTLRANRGQAAGAIVLRHLSDNDATPYVVHFRNDADSAHAGRPVYYYGDYCENLAGGYAAFADKIARYDPAGTLNGAESVA